MTHVATRLCRDCKDYSCVSSCPVDAFLEPRPAWDFEDGADSIAISGHKFIGAPIPCGTVLARRKSARAWRWAVIAAST